ncbi:hypothetical protein GCM10017056_50120 [Seohaeicola zhoushanensis]|uniref:Uncharacterized protein n=1 Tax=Seohaeicola zhoushanensis TaxID=1569283 RepID=A0A8J3H3C8_9RHOB|nr:hypothetical protein GCM10017056_50120 [Seohaeicola zhoushanensis]
MRRKQDISLSAVQSLKADIPFELPQHFPEFKYGSELVHVNYSSNHALSVVSNWKTHHGIHYHNDKFLAAKVLRGSVPMATFREW